MTGLSPAEAHENNPLNAKREIADSIAELRRTDQTFYNLMTLEIWSLAQTMDELKPGFWADYMRNRQAIVRQYIQERRQESPASSVTPTKIKATLARKLSPFHPLMAQSRQENLPKRISSFSAELEHDLPKVMSHSQQMNILSRPADDEATALVKAAIAGEALDIVAATPLEVDEATEATFALVKLPHLMRFPVLKVIAARPQPPALEKLTDVAIACWLTRNFLVPAPGERIPSVQKRLDAITVEPGQSVICQLGFQLLGAKSPVQVQLIKPGGDQQRLSVQWVEAQTQPAEAMVHLKNHGSQPITLKAGQAFCRLEVLCPTDHLPAGSSLSFERRSRHD